MKAKRVLPLLLASILLLAPGSGPIQAQDPGATGNPAAPVGGAFSYQGRLRDSGGSPISSTCSFSFSLWDAESNGTQVGGDSLISGVAVADGYFTALVNAGGEFGTSAFAGEARWLQIAVRCTGDPGSTTLSPRQPLTGAPYALSLRPGAVISGPVAGGSTLQATNTASSGTTYGLYGEAASTAGRGVYGYATATNGSNYGVYGRSESPDGYGVAGWGSAVSGTAYGVYGRSDSPDGCAVYGRASAPYGTTYGVYGRSDSTEGYGVYGSGGACGVYGLGDWDGVYGHGYFGVTGESDYAHGVQGISTATDAWAHGVYGQTSSSFGSGVFGSGPAEGVTGISDGTGVRGIAAVDSGVTYGVYGESRSADGLGVAGYNDTTSGVNYGVYGRSASTAGRGVFGFATATSGTNYGVRGVTQSPDGYGVYYVGGLGGQGLKTSLVETRDYGWRHLYTLESTGTWFEDLGTAQLLYGRAVVAIEPVFAQTVNLEEPYQVFLTPQGDCGLYVAEKTAASFTVRALDGKECSIAFDYRIVARRLGYEDLRLAVAPPPPPAEARLAGGQR